MVQFQGDFYFGLYIINFIRVIDGGGMETKPNRKLLFTIRNYSFLPLFLLPFSLSLQALSSRQICFLKNGFFPLYNYLCFLILEHMQQFQVINHNSNYLLSCLSCIKLYQKKFHFAIITRTFFTNILVTSINHYDFCEDEEFGNS